MRRLPVVRVLAFMLLPAALLLARSSTSRAQGYGTIIAGQCSTVVLLPGQGNAYPVTSGLIVAAPGCTVVMQAGTPTKAPAQTKTTTTPVAILTRKEYTDNKGDGQRAKWQSGNLVNYAGKIEWDKNRTINKPILIVFDEPDPKKPGDEQALATITYTSDNLKNVYTVRRSLKTAVQNLIFSDGEGTSDPIDYTQVKAISFGPSASTTTTQCSDAAIRYLVLETRLFDRGFAMLESRQQWLEMRWSSPSDLIVGWRQRSLKASS